MPAMRAAPSSGARRALYLQLDPGVWRAAGLSLLNKLLVLLIIAAEATAVVETEPMISQGHEGLFRALELLFGFLFLAEYVARLWVAVESPAFARARFPRLRYAVTPAAVIDLIAVLPALLALSAGGSLVLRLFRIGDSTHQ